MLEFPALLQLIDERSAAFRAAVAAAPGLDSQVPTCPEWTLSDLVEHLGGVHRFWAAVVAAGPADVPPAAPEPAPAVPRGLGALLAWSAESTGLLLGALREAGPDRACWTWWGASASPQDSGAVARHQVQEALVHTYDAQTTAGQPEPLPAAAALDGVDEFLATCCTTTSAWPYEPATVDYRTTEGRSWRLVLSADGARAERLPASGTAGAGGDADVPTVAALGTAGELVLVLYGRLPVDSLKVDGDSRVLDLLQAWEPED
ncbi:maleylpyruvate isomerase family mycothiol-dependent enzyme [Streptomyces sp. NRRL B-24484]|uniref:maleylpyruvate isomerase family mycothiol-dependent enzyme n=1 Tax=Streptomyces sp. NRRL B-24484 TaxID=1463833 RepID=UPI0004BE527B|nr:maleylpyruvate isomerase family mycothiol-dependent enzyme [Streptomyces sp. NRRL B-24484]